MRGPHGTIPPEKQDDDGDHGEPALVQPNPEEVVDDDPVKAEDLLEQYAWMENQEEFDQQVMAEIAEEEYIEENFEDLLEEEDQSWVHFDPDESSRNGHSSGAINGLTDGVNGLNVNGNDEMPSDLSSDDDENDQNHSS